MSLQVKIIHIVQKSCAKVISFSWTMLYSPLDASVVTFLGCADVKTSCIWKGTVHAFTNYEINFLRGGHLKEMKIEQGCLMPKQVCGFLPRPIVELLPLS